MQILLKKLVLFALVLGFVVIGCSDDDDDDMGTLTLAFNGLENLGSDYAYEGWIMVDGTPMSTGTFTVNDAGELSAADFELDAASLESATKFILTIEPDPDADAAPSNTKMLAGDFSGGSATLTVADAAALGDDFMSATASYILNTPSTSTDDSDYDAGIWWLDPATGPGPTLNLPTLPAGWMYEGWIVGDSGPVTTGTFTSASGDDSDMGGPTAGPDGVPPFPGQDYINPIMRLIGTTAVISIEPDPDNSVDPFTLKPMIDLVDTVAIGVLQDMTNQYDTFPTGTAAK